MTMILIVVVYFWQEVIDNSILKFLFIFIFVPIYSFLLTPLFTLVNIFKYKSPMLLVLVDKKKNHALHRGTSFNYLVKVGNVKSGTAFHNKILECHLEGIFFDKKELSLINVQTF